MLGALMFDSEMCNFDTEIMKIEGKPTVFPYNVLKAATRSFNVSSKLGEGGFGVVYKVWNSSIHILVVARPRDIDGIILD